MLDWREKALQESRCLKPYWARKHGWDPEVIDHDDAVDLFIGLRGKRLGDKAYQLRLRYQPDWQIAGRRENFVDPEDPKKGGLEFWPPPGIRAINTEYRPNPAGPVIPCVCLRGSWGYHSLLHPNESGEGTTLLTFLLELQGVINE